MTFVAGITRIPKKTGSKSASRPKGEQVSSPGKGREEPSKPDLIHGSRRPMKSESDVNGVLSASPHSLPGEFETHCQTPSEQGRKGTGP